MPKNMVDVCCCKMHNWLNKNEVKPTSMDHRVGHLRPIGSFWVTGSTIGNPKKKEKRFFTVLLVFYFFGGGAKLYNIVDTRIM